MDDDLNGALGDDGQQVLVSEPGEGASPRLPGVQGIWVFVLIDVSFFGLLFLSYVQEKAKDPGVFEQAQLSMHVGFGLTNMVVLLTSSWFVALAVHYIRTDAVRAATVLLWLGFLCGAVFVVVKILEYRGEIAAGYSLLTNGFFMFYFLVTGIHFLHVLIGMVCLALLARKSSRRGDSPPNVRLVESVAIYWHMVDLLWIMIFPLLYLAA